MHADGRTVVQCQPIPRTGDKWRRPQFTDAIILATLQHGIHYYPTERPVCTHVSRSVSNSSDSLEYDQAVHAAANYAYSPNEKNILFSVVAVGAMVAVYPAMWLIQGTGLSTGFILIGTVTRQWSMQKQNAFFIAFLTCFFQIGPIFTMPVAAALCTSSLGWPSVYYLHALITCILFLLFLYFYREQPQRHAFVSAKELDRIKRGKGETDKREPLPLKAILTSNAIIAIWITAIANFMGIQVTMQFSPIYLNKVMGFPVEQTGLFSAVPQVATFVVKILAGVLADKASCCQPVTSVKIFNLVSVGGMGIAFFVLAVIPAQHNHFVMGVNSFLNCLAALLAPVVVNIFVRDDTWDEWWYVWIVHGIVMTVCNVYFMIFGKGEPAEWTKPGYGAKVTPGLSTPPRSHPRDGRFSMRLNDKISVSVRNIVLSRCDTCRGHRDGFTSFRDIDAQNAESPPTLLPKGWSLPWVKEDPLPCIKETSDSLEDYLDAEPSQPPKSNELKNTTVPCTEEKQ
ncbi:transporter, major facilitator family protein [Teladorsagia circumcincta]|uniref:Transporter, major facilitator family protein n=1 Tax=Teladorsagia circumcincta TaxID=45464 RepID=A0A2G9UXU2_TELCI|nr:transporter, major facilitator family protein [Teladorsagia circumcincta]